MSFIWFLKALSLKRLYIQQRQLNHCLIHHIRHPEEVSNMGLGRVGIGSDCSPMFGDHSDVSTYVFGSVLIFLEINTAYHCISACALQQASKFDQVGQCQSLHPGSCHYCAWYIDYQNRSVWDSSHRMQSEPHVPNVRYSSVRKFLLRQVKILLILVGLTSAIHIFSQFLIWSLTLYKCVVLKRSSGWQTIPLLSLVVRDGFWVFASISSKWFWNFKEGYYLRSCSTPWSSYCGGSATRVFFACGSAYSCPIPVGFWLSLPMYLKLLTIDRIYITTTPILVSQLVKSQKETDLTFICIEL